jgi:hypothetical protein
MEGESVTGCGCDSPQYLRDLGLHCRIGARNQHAHSVGTQRKPPLITFAREYAGHPARPVRHLHRPGHARPTSGESSIRNISGHTTAPARRQPHPASTCIRTASPTGFRASIVGASPQHDVELPLYSAIWLDLVMRCSSAIDWSPAKNPSVVPPVGLRATCPESPNDPTNPQRKQAERWN